MNNSNNNEKGRSESEEQKFYLVPADFLKSIKEGMEKIYSSIRQQNSDAKSLGDYITEEEAKKLLNKKTTWFWNMRTSGYLPYSKMGGTIYYSKSDILTLLDKLKHKRW